MVESDLDTAMQVGSKTSVRPGSERRVVFTCLFGGYDQLRSPRILEPGLEYICITDGRTPTPPAWRVVIPRPEELETMTIETSRWPRLAKLLPHRFLQDYDVSLYIDANLEIVGSLASLFAKLDRADAVYFRHPENRRDVFEEAEVCKAMGKDAPNRIER